MHENETGEAFLLEGRVPPRPQRCKPVVPVPVRIRVYLDNIRIWNPGAFEGILNLVAILLVT